MEAEAGLKDVVAQQAVFLRLFDGDVQTLYGDGVLGPDVDIALRGAYRIACNGHGLHHAEGVALQNASIHECAGVALVGVAADVFEVALGVGGELPFKARREASAATATEAGVLYLVNDLLRGHLREHLAQGHVAAGADVLVDVLGVDDAAVPQGNALLLAIEIGVGEGFHRLVGALFHVEQPGHGAALQQVLLHDLGNVILVDHDIVGAVRVDDHVGTLGTQAQTSGLHHTDLLIQTELFQLCFKFLCQSVGIGGSAAGAGTY